MKNNKKLQIVTTTSLIFTMTAAMALKPILVLADEGMATAGQFTAGEVEEGEGTIAAPEQPADPVVPETPAEPTPAVPTPTPVPDTPVAPTPTPVPDTPVAPTPTPEPEAPVTPANPSQPTEETPVVTPTPENPPEPVELTPIPEPSKSIDLVKSVNYGSKPTTETKNSKSGIIKTGLRTNIFLSLPIAMIALFAELFVLRKKRN